MDYLRIVHDQKTLGRHIVAYIHVHACTPISSVDYNNFAWFSQMSDQQESWSAIGLGCSATLPPS